MSKVPNKFIGLNGTWKTRELFYDVMKATGHPSYTQEKLDSAPYNLYHKIDHRPLLRELFMEVADPTGLKFARKHLDSYEHLLYMIRKSPWFRREWSKWVDELALQIKSDALDKIQEISKTDTASALAASKYLANEEYRDTPAEPAKRGRPSKEEISGQLKNEIKKIQQVDDDLARAKNVIPFGGRAS